MHIEVLWGFLVMCFTVTYKIRMKQYMS